MKLLVISPYPMYDRASGDLRLYQLLGMMGRPHEVYFCCVGQEWQLPLVGEDEIRRYKADLAAIGVHVLDDSVHEALRRNRYDMIWFEFYYHAAPFIDFARAFQPQAKLVMDTVDVHFIRLAAKAAVSGDPEDAVTARREKIRELDIYSRVDAILTVTEADALELRNERLITSCHIIPNVHEIHDPVPAKSADGPELIFVGSFRHEPNLDAVRYFCEEIFPLVLAQVPNAHLSIVGASPPSEILDLASERIEVTGYVPDTAPYLQRSDISIAPLRFGAGMKGKIGEAMSFGLPVVTTSIGAEGFGLTPGEHVLVADEPERFADEIIRLYEDKRLYEQVRIAGHDFIRTNYGPEAVNGKLDQALKSIGDLAPSKLPALESLKIRFLDFVERHVLWRLRSAN